MSDPIIATLQNELTWLKSVIWDATALLFAKEDEEVVLFSPVPPDLKDDESDYALLAKKHSLSFDERLILILALAPSLQPTTLDPFYIRNTVLERQFTEFGGAQSSGNHFVPTVQTAAFLLEGAALGARFRVLDMLGAGKGLARCGLLELGDAGTGGPFSRPLQANGVALARLLASEELDPGLGADFPAQRLNTRLEWSDLVVSDHTRELLQEIMEWNTYGQELMSSAGPGRLIMPGFRSLFHGPPGTGKTLAASLLGSRLHRPVYRVDLSLTLSKWIGETEKNLARVFDTAQWRNWILFFDEADALFGKRTQINSSNDRFANQDVAFILQRIENFSGTVILATNLKINMDQAFMRRFQSVIHFEAPGPKARLKLWETAFSDSDWKGADVDLYALAKDYELTGGGIANVLRTAMLAAMVADRRYVNQGDLLSAITREFANEGRVETRPG